MLRVFFEWLQKHLEKRVSIEFITTMLLKNLEISIRGKHRILMRRVLSADKTPHTNEKCLSADKTPHTYKEEVNRYKVTARVLSTI